MATIHQLKSFSNNEKKARTLASGGVAAEKGKKSGEKKESRKLKQNKQQTHPQRHQPFMHREKKL